MKINLNLIFDKLLIIISAVLAVSVIAIGNSSLAQANIATIADPIHDVFGDGCTTASSFNRWVTGDVAELLGQTEDPFRKGYMNARVYSPILDWDDNYSNLYGFKSPEKPIEYLNKFSFLTVPVPNNKWVENYGSKSYGGDNKSQLEYDIQALQNLASGGGKVSERTKFVANPFLYQQAAVVEPNGMPSFPAIKTLLGDNDYVNQGESIVTSGGFDSILGPKIIEDRYYIGWPFDRWIETGTISLALRLLDAPGGPAAAIGSITTMAKQLIKITMNSDIPGGNITEQATDWFDPATTSEGQFPALAGFLDSVDLRFAGAVSTLDTVDIAPGEDPKDDSGRYCNLGNGKQVPMYSFNNFGAAHHTFVLPGTINSLFTKLVGRGMSNDGIHLTIGRTINGNKALDCYGKHNTPTVNWITGQTIGSVVGISGLLEDAVLLALDAATSSAATPIWEAIKHLPWPEQGSMYYGLGMGFVFAMKPSDVFMPDSLKTRSIDWTASGEELIDSVMPNTSGTDMDHGNSVNGLGHDVTFKLKLKKPYHLKPVIATDTVSQDGRTINVDIDLKKNGYMEKTSSTPYKESETENGGPTDDPGQIQPRIKVVRMIAEPGSDVKELTNHQYGGSLKEEARKELPADIDYIEGDSLCKFMKSKVKSHGVAEPSLVRECSYIEPDSGIDVSMDASTNNLDVKSLSIKIPAETEPGTKYCFAVYTDLYSNDMKYSGVDYWDVSSGGYETPRDKRMLSRTHCAVSGYKPSFQVRGGDLIAGGVVDTETNTKEYLANPATQRKYGSWVEYGVIAGGPIKQLASGAGYRVGMPAGAATNLPEGTPPAEGEVENRRNVGPLSFSNNWSGDTTDHGRFNTEINDGFGNIVTQFTELAGTGTTIGANEVDVASLASGVHILRPNTVLRSSKKIEPNKSLILLAPDESNIRIAENIELQDSYPDESALSQVVIAPLTSDADFTININPDVSRVDSWLINPSGKLNTCFIDGGSLSEQTPRGFDWPCYNTLTVNGPVSAHTLLLRRSGSRDQNNVPAYELEQSVAGENFNLRPDAYIWAANYVSDFGRKLVTTNLLDLPPRF